MTLPFAVISRSSETFSVTPQRLQRAEGSARIAFRLRDGETALDRLHQSGAAKIRLPRMPAGGPPEFVLINIAGGLTGGDRLSCEVRIGDGCRAIATSQACEKVYRSLSGEAEVRNLVEVGRKGRLDWIPQETILFDGARLARRTDVDLARGATLLMMEATIFGRAAHGETVRRGLFTDTWRIRCEGRLLYADGLRFDWADAGLLRRPAVLAGGGAMATILCVAEGVEARVGRLRDLIGGAGGVSAWNGKLIARLVAEGGAALRRVLTPVLMDLLDGAALPRLWHS